MLKVASYPHIYQKKHFLPLDSIDFEGTTDEGTTPGQPTLPAMALGPIAHSVNRNSILNKIPFKAASPSQRIVAKLWLQRSLARGRKLTLIQTLTPIVQFDPATSLWTLARRLPPGPSRLSTNSPGLAAIDGSSFDVEDLPGWAIRAIRIQQSPRSFEIAPSSRCESISKSQSLECLVLSLEKEKGRGGSCALRALRDRATSS